MLTSLCVGRFFAPNHCCSDGPAGHHACNIRSFSSCGSHLSGSSTFQSKISFILPSRCLVVSLCLCVFLGLIGILVQSDTAAAAAAAFVSVVREGVVTALPTWLPRLPVAGQIQSHSLPFLSPDIDFPLLLCPCSHRTHLHQKNYMK